MPPKNKFPMDIDNRESKRSVVQRFMSSEDEISNEPEKKQEQQKELPHYDFPKPKKVDEIQVDEDEEVAPDKARKPIKDAGNPFVQTKQKNPADNKKPPSPFESMLSEISKIPDKPDRPERKDALPNVGENLRPEQDNPKAAQTPDINIKDRSKPEPKTVSESKVAETVIEEVVGEIVEEVEEYGGEIPEDIADEKAIVETEEGEEIVIVDESNENADEIIEEESSDIEESEIDESEITEESEGEPDNSEFTLENVLTGNQEKIDNLLKTNAEEYMAAAHTYDSEEAEKIVSRAVVRKIIKRAYDYDDQTIAHYIEMLEKNDVKSKYYFKNTWEDMVVDEVEATLKHVKDICKCERCFAEICAITLNSLTPHYVTTAMDELYDRVSMLDLSKQIQITTEVFNSIDSLKANPLH